MRRYETVPAVARDLVADTLGPGHEIEIEIAPDRCDRCGEPIYLVNPTTADELGDEWRTAAGRPICSTEIIRRYA